MTAGFSLTPEGGLSQSVWEDDGGIFHGSFDFYTTSRPQNSFAVDANAFRGRHELKFGFAWRQNDVKTTDSYPGTGIITYHVGYPEMLGQVTRDFALDTSAGYSSAYVSDTWTVVVVLAPPPSVGLPMLLRVGRRRAPPRRVSRLSCRRSRRRR